MKKWRNYYNRNIVTWVIACLVCFAGGFKVGYDHHKPKTIFETKIVETKDGTPQINAKIGTRTVVSYVPKVFTPKGKENTDIEANIESTGVTVKVNGKERVLPLLKEETQKFEDGKVVLNQTSHVVFDVTVPERNEFKLYTGVSSGNGKPEVVLGAEKKNGKFVYGGEINQDKQYKVYARYELLKFFSK